MSDDTDTETTDTNPGDVPPDIDWMRVLRVALSVALVFGAVGYYLPVLWYQAAPLDQVYAVENGVVENTSSDTSALVVQFDRRSQQPFRTEKIYELVRVDPGGTETIYKRWYRRSSTEPGLRTIKTQLPFANATVIPPGTYRVDMFVEVRLPRGVRRATLMQTEQFRITAPPGGVNQSAITPSGRTVGQCTSPVGRAPTRRSNIGLAIGLVALAAIINPRSIEGMLSGRE